MSETPNIGLPLVPQGTLDPAAGLNDALNVADVLIQTAVISMALSSPPTSPADGDLYIPAAPATGLWTGLELHVVRFVEQGAFWQEYEPGVRVHYVLNEDDGNFYKFAPGSPGSWVLLAGLGDAPADGEYYARRNSTWAQVTIPPTLTIQSADDSPPVVVSDVEVIVLGDGLEFEEVEPGVVEIRVNDPPVVIEESGTARSALVTDRNTYVRFTNAAAKTYTFNDGLGYQKGDEFSGRNHGAGDLTIVATTGMTINAPAGGSLVIPQGGTFTVKIVSDDGAQADLFGVTD